MFIFILFVYSILFIVDGFVSAAPGVDSGPEAFQWRQPEGQPADQ